MNLFGTNEERDDQLIKLLAYEAKMAKWSHYLSQHEKHKGTGRGYLRYMMKCTRQQLRKAIPEIQAWRAYREYRPMELVDTRGTSLAAYMIVLTLTGVYMMTKDNEPWRSRFAEIEAQYQSDVSRSFGIPPLYFSYPSLSASRMGWMEHHWGGVDDVGEP